MSHTRFRCGLSALAVSLSFAACTPTVEQLPAPVPPEADACGAQGFQHLIGKKVTALAGLTLPKETRIIPPGTAVTMDYRPDRLNIDLDAKDRIVRLYCT